MKNIKVRNKLFVSFGIVLLLFIFSITLGLACIEKIKINVSNFYEAPYKVRNSSVEVKANMEALQKNLYRMITTRDEDINQSSINNMDSIMKSTSEELKIIDEHYKGDKQLLQNLNSSRSKVLSARDNVTKLAEQNRSDEALELMENEFSPAIKKFADDLDELTNYANQKGERLIADINTTQVQSMFVLIFSCLISVIISIILCIYITKLIVTPLDEIKQAADEMSKGNLKVKIKYSSKDEFGQVANKMKQTISTLDSYIQDLGHGMTELSKGNLFVNLTAQFKGDFVHLKNDFESVIFNLNETISQINSSSEQVSSGSAQVSKGAQSLSQGASEQASSIQQLAATINEISEQIINSTESSEQANEKVKIVENEILHSNEKMQKMINAVSEISKSSSEIGKIIKTIEDIAFQTNILALNAAVEAARAGAAGKGFAIVADEVRSLASKSGEASKDISVLIENSIKAVENGTEIANETAEALVVAVNDAKEVTEVVDEIVSISKNQADSLSQINIGVEQISYVVQTNSATAEESAATSEELSQQAQVLKQLVNKFKLNSEVNTIIYNKK